MKECESWTMQSENYSPVLFLFTSSSLPDWLSCCPLSIQANVTHFVLSLKSIARHLKFSDTLVLQTLQNMLSDMPSSCYGLCSRPPTSLTAAAAENLSIGFILLFFFVFFFGFSPGLIFHEAMQSPVVSQKSEHLRLLFLCSYLGTHSWLTFHSDLYQ